MTAKKEAPQNKIGWDHPLVSEYGICPDYLLQELLEYTDETWSKKRREWTFAKSFKGTTLVSLRAFEQFIGQPCNNIDTDD